MREAKRRESYAPVAACLAVLSGCLLLVLLGAPMRMIIINLAALGIALAAMMCARAVPSSLVRRAAPGLLLGAAALVPLTAWIGASTQGISRWMVIGGITLQPTMMVCPALVLAIARRRSWIEAGAVMIAAAGTALQPDPAAAAMLIAGLLALLSVGRPDKPTGLAASTCAVAFASGFFRSIPLPPVPFVEGALAGSWADGWLTTAVAVLTLVLLFAPALFAGAALGVARAFVALWASAILASVAGAFPTPILGFGGSAVLGYLLSVGVMIASSRASALAGSTEAPAGSARSDYLRFVWS